MSASESSTMIESESSELNSKSKPRLASLRAQYTSTSSPSLDQVVIKNERFRQEERLRATLRRERNIRQKALSEKLSKMQENIASELSEQHELTREQL